ncbi:MupG family TIM beta-alpha barrel fold protein [Dielma fastidiosa]|uniref:MupG family TIM beta-alpha barrel fold protein n=1 Tax=Dielma fastidiosa TaxID=1034346 RepID=A0AB35UJJ9_9FIRM|nr:MupG family TIM beta-alpha barrel fold protein [Dielma fastidiosa]MDY5167011.1 MupG family TIM beta-alpha barrel fold protein [Dielma fastidiosa]
MMTLGISVYPDLQTVAEIKSYIEMASHYGIQTVFSSMWSVEGNKPAILNYFYELIEIAHCHSMQVCLDVNPECFKKLDADYNDLSVFKEINADILRMDISYDLEKSIALINNPYSIRIEFNASVTPPNFIQQLIEQGANVSNMSVSHNFYPQRYTGMKWNQFIENNEALKKLGVRVSAFISSQNDNTLGVWGASQGLCTVEKLRFLPMEQQVRILAATENVDQLVVGNAPASAEELQACCESLKVIEPDDEMPGVSIMKKFGAERNRFFPQKKLRLILNPLVTENEKDILFHFMPHSDVGDSSEWIWRSRMPRFLKPNIPYRCAAGEMFDVGDVVMVNNHYQHYAGEVQIVLQPIVNDGTRNLLGHLIDGEEQILELIRAGDVVVFLKGEN